MYSTAITKDKEKKRLMQRSRKKSKGHSLTSDLEVMYYDLAVVCDEPRTPFPLPVVCFSEVLSFSNGWPLSSSHRFYSLACV